ncbi:MAG TPA: hypothetical protein VK644_00045 [Chitinophagaceae bacterium]|nr:hypothetical protein [Chitinophagaceae bacterium]
MQKLTGLVISLFIFSCVPAQDIDGFWKGTLVMDPGGCFPVYNIQFQLVVSGNKVAGNSYHYSDTANYVKEEFTGTYDQATKALRIEEQKVSVFHIPPDCLPCIKTYVLEYHTDGKEEQLRGSWTGKMMDGRSSCPAGTIVLTRIQKSAFKPDLPKTLVDRKNELIKEIYVDTGSIKLDFYDNGQIDGDTISVYVNSIPVVSQKMLTAKPLTVYVRIDFLRREQEVIMVGENLGSIPPNTALMMVNAGDKRYQLYLTSDEKKNALVKFIYEKPK